MDVKEAITQLTGLKKYCEGMAECDESGSYVFDLDVQALDMAITALSPPNEPLTLEQLREMDGEPVWVTPTGFWALVISKRGQRVQLMCSDGETVWADKEIELVGPVYRRLPEGEENAQ